MNKSRIIYVLSTAVFITLLTVSIPVFSKPTREDACEGCHTYNPALIDVSTDIPSIEVDPGETFTVSVWASGGLAGATSLKWPSEVESNALFTISPVRVDDGSVDDPDGTADGEIGSETSPVITTIIAPDTAGEYVIRVYVSDGKPEFACDYQDVDVIVTAPPPPPVYGPCDLVRRSAWPEHHHFDISTDEDGKQTLFGKVKNLGTSETASAVEFKIYNKETGELVKTLTAPTRILMPEAIADFWVDWETPIADKYYVEARAYFDSDGDGTLDTYGLKIKTFSFAVVP